MHTWRERCRHPPREEERSKEVVKSFIEGSSSGSLFTFGKLSGYFSHTWPALGPSPICVWKIFPKWTPAHRPMGGFGITYSGVVPLFLTPKKPFMHMCNVSLAPRMENIWIFNSHKGLAPLHSCMTVTLQCPQETKPDCLLFLLLLLFQSARRRLIVNA